MSDFWAVFHWCPLCSYLIGFIQAFTLAPTHIPKRQTPALVCFQLWSPNDTRATWSGVTSRTLSFLPLSYSIFFKSVCRKTFVHRHRTFSNELVSWHPWTRVERGLNALIKKGMMAKFMFLRTHALFYGEELHCCDIGMTWHSMVIFHFQFELLFLTWPMPRFY